LPEPSHLTAADHKTIAAWLVHSSKMARASFLDRLARYKPELGWQAILTVLRRSESETYLGELSLSLRWLIVQYGPAFIDRIEAEAARSTRLRACLGQVSARPGSRIPEQLWARLSRAAETAVGPVSPSMSELWELMPDLTELLETDFAPLDPTIELALSADDLQALADDWLIHAETSWAWDEVRRVVDEDPAERAWSVVLELIRASPDDAALGSVGAGPLEDLLERHGDAVIDALEMAAADRRVRYCISNVWQRDMSDALWARLMAARGSEPQRG